MSLLSSTWYGNKDKTSTSYPVYFDSTSNRKLLQSDLPSACHYRLNRTIFDPSEVSKAFLLIRLNKCLNPHVDIRSKVISILLIGYILHWSSSAPQQHKSVQYRRLQNVALHLHREVSHTYLLQPHFIGCRGDSGAGGNFIITEIYLSQSRFQT